MYKLFNNKQYDLEHVLFDKAVMQATAIIYRKTHHLPARVIPIKKAWGVFVNWY